MGVRAAQVGWRGCTCRGPGGGQRVSSGQSTQPQRSGPAGRGRGARGDRRPGPGVAFPASSTVDSSSPPRLCEYLASHHSVTHKLSTDWWVLLWFCQRGKLETVLKTEIDNPRTCVQACRLQPGDNSTSLAQVHQGSAEHGPLPCGRPRADFTTESMQQTPYAPQTPKPPLGPSQRVCQPT